MTTEADVLVISPHPDDAEYGVAGTVARWTKEGKRVIYVVCTNGDKGIYRFSGDGSAASKPLLPGAGGVAGRAAVIVKITANDGTVGWGQSVPIEKWSYETLEAAASTLRDHYAPRLIGHDPTDIAGAYSII